MMWMELSAETSAYVHELWSKCQEVSTIDDWISMRNRFGFPDFSSASRSSQQS